VSNETLADKILWIVDSRKCESCTDEECLGKDCEGCLADCLLALFTEQLAGLVEALKHSSQVIPAYNTMLAMRATDEDIIAMLDSEFDILGLQIEQVLAQIGEGK
jgi:hypothetical protein